MISSFKHLMHQPFAMGELDLKNLIQSHEPKAGPIEDFFGLTEKPLELEVMDGVAVIPVKGVMMGRNVQTWEKELLGYCDTGDIETLIKQAVSSADIKAIVLDIATPGGSTQGIPELYETIYKARASKPIVAYTEDMACSAGYWIASACHAIYGTESSLVGCIGVYSLLYDSTALYDKAGIKPILIKAGALKGIGIEGLPVTEPQQKAIQDSVDYVYAKFTQAVQKGRGQTIKSEYMQGLDYWAPQALEYGLVDEIRNDFEDCLAEVRLLIS